MSEENLEIVRRLYKAVSDRDIDTVFQLYDRMSSSMGLATLGRRCCPEISRSFEATRNFASGSKAYYGEWENLRDDIEELIDAGDKVISVVTTKATGRASGIEVEWKHNVGLGTIRDARIIRIQWLPSREEALEAAGLSE